MGKTAGLNFDVFLDDHGMKRSMQELKSTATMLKSEMRANFAELKSGGQITDAYAGKVKDSERAIKAQNNIIADAKKAQKGLNLQTEEGRTEFAKQEKIITSAKNSITSLSGEQKRAKSSLDFYKSGLSELNSSMKTASSASKAYVDRLKAEGKQNEANKVQLTGLKDKYSSLSEIYSKQETELKKIGNASNETSEAYLKQKTRLDQTGKAMAKARTDMSGLNKTIKEANPTIFDKLKSKISGVAGETEKSNHLFGKMAIASTIGNSVSNAFSSAVSSIKESVKAGYELDEAGEKIGKQWKGLGLSSKQTQGMLDQIGKFRNEANMSGTAVDALQKRFYALTHSTKETKELTETMASFGKASGLADTKIAALAPMMGRLMSSTTVTSSLFTRTMGQAPQLQKAIIDASGMSQKAFMKLLAAGKITGSQLQGYMEKASSQSGKAWKQFGSDSGGMLARIQGMWKSANASFAKPLAESAFTGISKAMATLYDKNGELNKTGQSVQNIAKALGEKVGDGIEVAMDWMVKNRKPLGEIATSVFNIAKDIGSGIWAVFSGIIKDLGGHFGKASDGAKPLADSINSISKHPKIFETLGKSLAVYFVASKLTGFIGALTTITRLSKRLIIKPQVDTVTGEKQLTTFGTWAQKFSSGLGINKSFGFSSKWNSMSKLGKAATVAVGVKAVYDSSTDIVKGMKERNPVKKLQSYGKGTGSVIGAGIGAFYGGAPGALLGSQIGQDLFGAMAKGWAKAAQDKRLKAPKVEPVTVKMGWSLEKGSEGKSQTPSQVKKEGVAGIFDYQNIMNGFGEELRSIMHPVKSTKETFDYYKQAEKEKPKSTFTGFLKFEVGQLKWPKAPKWLSWLTTTQNPGKGNKPITMPKIKFPKIKLPNIWKWLTTDVKPKTKPIEAPKFKKIKWPTLPKWMNWKNWHWPKFKKPKLPKIKWPKVPNLAKSWSSATKKLSKNFNSWKKSFSKSWSKHWSSTRSTLSRDWSSMQKNTKKFGSNMNGWFGGFKKSFAKHWSKHWSSVKSTLANRWNDMRKKSGSWGTSMEKWRSKFSSTFQKGFRSLGSGIHDIWSNMWSGLHKLAHSGMKGVVDIINDGINGIDGVIHLFGGKKHAIKPIHFATGTGSLSSNFRKSIDRVTPAIVNDEPGATNPELIYRKASNSIEYSTKKNAHTLLMPGDEVANATDSAKMGLAHFAKGGIGSFFGGIGSAISGTVSKVAQTASWLKKLFNSATKIIAHPIKSVESLFKYSKNGTKGIFTSIGKGTFDKTAKNVKNWWGDLWSMVNLNGDSAGGNWAHNPGLSETNGFGASRSFGTHDGVDFSGKLGSAITAVHGGTVTHIGKPLHGWPYSQLGDVITVKSSDGYQEIYQEFGDMGNIKVSTGDEIKTGQKIATLGRLNGAGSGAHVHIGVSKGSLWNHGGGSTKGWYDVTKMHGGSDGSSKSKESSSALDKLVKSEVGSGFFKLIKKIANKFGDAAGGSMGNPSGSSVARWKPYVIKALKANGFKATASQIAAWMRVISRESGGNPKAINSWDSNARAGHPSKGLVQTIEQTFNAYKFKGHDQIYNGFDDLLAGINYMKHIYGKGASAFSRVSGSKGYANGGFSSTAKLANISEGNLMESVIPLSKPSRAWELIGKSAAYLTKKNNSHTASANNNEGDSNAYMKQLVDQNSQLLKQISQFMSLVDAKPTGITPQAVYNANKQQTTIQTNRYNRSLGLS